jgi:hypothetical protein
VTRADLPPGAQAAQAAHAALMFAACHPGTGAADGVLVVLAAAGELELCRLAEDAARGGYLTATWTEPDLGGQVTAVAVYDAARLCARFPLALREGVSR